MSVINGVCEFCNQAVIEGAECTCYEAKRERKIKEKISFANENVDELFNFDEDNGTYDIDIKLIKIMKKANELIANGLLRAITIKINSSLSVVIAIDSKGTIKVTKKKIYTDTMEATDD